MKFIVNKTKLCILATGLILSTISAAQTTTSNGAAAVNAYNAQKQALAVKKQALLSNARTTPSNTSNAASTSPYGGSCGSDCIAPQTFGLLPAPQSNVALMPVSPPPTSTTTPIVSTPTTTAPVVSAPVVATSTPTTTPTVSTPTVSTPTPVVSTPVAAATIPAAVPAPTYVWVQGGQTWASGIFNGIPTCIPPTQVVGHACSIPNQNCINSYTDGTLLSCQLQ
jgi:hypothetical protein